MEKLHLRLQRPVPGVDHMNAVDPEQFARFHPHWDTIAANLDVDRINDFYVYEGEYGNSSTRWHSSAKGLMAARSVLEHLRDNRGALDDQTHASYIDLMETIESVLDDADLRDTRFCFVGNY
ncbi:hypothetical protein TBK1r_66410 [Stieleria magnilauensis]|uniref:Uncharacterized protein n=2 Tax=Stieleria magnilauensis TaxID=2527963 RepID=A0ABX5Y345_9BACT|nr:hypothetical protein TBK1r_66410 [Planctomycetes bacterium TBK1r]